MNTNARAIAFYLPQFYPTPENDKWWGEGFTEWTNVSRAKPLYKGHYQPKIPGKLSYYDLRLPSVREQQANLARDAGIEGFCYWHYWFGNGQRLLDRVFREVVESRKPNYPFCLCWANHTWYNKHWNPQQADRILIEQTYPGTQDYIDHFYAMLPAFKDERYIKCNGKLLFGFFEPWGWNPSEFMDIWNQLAKQNGLKGFHFFAFCYGLENYQKTNTQLFDSCVLDTLFDSVDYSTRKHFFKTHHILSKTKPINVASYNHYCQKTLQIFKSVSLIHPCIVPNFDHSPRSSTRGHILYDNTPEAWGQLLSDTINFLSARPKEEKFVFIKAWNEWGEGNYLEPDMCLGSSYLEETRKALIGK